MGYNFSLAGPDDIEAIEAIEKEHFKSGVAYTKEFIREWMSHNLQMFWVVKDDDGKVLAHTILVPVTKECYEKLRNNEIHDMSKFTKDDVMQDMNSDYFYTASIAMTASAKLGVFRELISGIMWFYNEHGERIITTPITEPGLKVTKSLGYTAIAGKDGLGVNYEVLIDEVRERNSRFIRRSYK